MLSASNEMEQEEPKLSGMCMREGGNWHRKCDDWRCECECHNENY